MTSTSWGRCRRLSDLLRPSDTLSVDTRLDHGSNTLQAQAAAPGCRWACFPRRCTRAPSRRAPSNTRSGRVAIAWNSTYASAQISPTMMYSGRSRSAALSSSNSPITPSEDSPPKPCRVRPEASWAAGCYLTGGFDGDDLHLPWNEGAHRVQGGRLARRSTRRRTAWALRFGTQSTGKRPSRTTSYGTRRCPPGRRVVLEASNAERRAAR